MERTGPPGPRRQSFSHRSVSDSDDWRQRDLLSTRTDLPTFRYHPDPIGTGSIEPSEVVCVVCSKARGFIYTAEVHSQAEIRSKVCPWCIADGSAHDRFDAEFADEPYVGGRNWSSVPPAIARIVVTRTPSFIPWQHVYWFACCNDAAAFLGRAGHAEIVAQFAGVEASLRQEMDMDGPEYDADWTEYFATLNKDDSPTAYVFRCLHCGALGGFSDCH